jgi:hypothetical protein
MNTNQLDDNTTDGIADLDLVSFSEFDSPEGSESEDDLARVDVASLREAVVFSTDWTAETILNQLAKGTINLDPSFQRRNAWQDSRKSRFIESLLLGLPIPQIVLAESPTDKGKFLVIDGKQRLLCLQQFAGLDGYKPLRLSKLEHRPELNGVTYADLKNDPNLLADLNAFENQPIRAVVVRNWKSESFLYLIFYRLNSGSVPLSPQELRQALHPGPFMKFAVNYTETSKGIQKVLNLSKADFRMRDVELLIRFFAFAHFIAEYKGNLKSFLDDTCKRLNFSWKKNQPELEAEASNLEEAIAFCYETFEGTPFRKWDGSKFESRFNRAVFDVMTYYFADSSIRVAAKQHQGAIIDTFKILCEEDPNFRRSIETTTKSIDATDYRFTTWARALNRILGAGTVAYPR